MSKTILPLIAHLPTSYIGNLSEFQASILGLLRSTTVTQISGHFSAITAHVGPPTYPAPMQQILLTGCISRYAILFWFLSKIFERISGSNHNNRVCVPVYVACHGAWEKNRAPRFKILRAQPHKLACSLPSF